jgi:hypothetical protein
MMRKTRNKPLEAEEKSTVDSKEYVRIELNQAQW